MPQRSTYPDGEPCWADVVTPDLDAAKAFYQALFGWECQGSGPEFGNYTMCLVDGRPVAGITPAPPSGAGFPAMWNVYLASSDADTSAARAEQGGGKILMGPLEIPGSGRMMVGLDPAGAAFGVWQGTGHVGARITGEPGTMAWAEAYTRDAAATDVFYHSMFGYEQEQIGDGAGFDYTVWSLGGPPVCGRLLMGDQFPAEMQPHWLAYFAVDDVDAAAERAAANGGTVNDGPFDSPHGRLAIVSDPQGALFSVIDMSRTSAG
jgi:predicted enzyme related to lactoylglutathione lyase